MRVIIAGSRHIKGQEHIRKAVEASGFKITEVVSGGCRGVDKEAEGYARSVLKVPVKVFPAKWDKYGKAAGPIRNREMALYAQALIAIWDGKSYGTLDMIERARDNGLLVSICNV